LDRSKQSASLARPAPIALRLKVLAKRAILKGIRIAQSFVIYAVRRLARRPGAARNLILDAHRSIGNALEESIPEHWRLQLPRNAFTIGVEALNQGDLIGSHRAFAFAQHLAADADSIFYEGLTRSLLELKAAAERKAGEILSRADGRPHFVFSAVVWGDEYIDNFMGYMMRSLLAPGNLPALNDANAHMSIITTPAGAERIKTKPSFAGLQRYAQVHFFTFSEELTKPFHYSRPNYHFYRLYGALDHTSIHFARALGAAIFFIVVDGILSSNTLGTLRRYLDEGYDICANASIVSNRETLLPALDELYGDSEAISIPARELANLGLQHVHHYTEQRLVIEQNRSFDKYPRELYFPTADGLVVHAIYQHPLVISARAICSDVKFDYFIVDSKLMARIFSDAREFKRLKVIKDSAEAYVANFAPRTRVFDATGRPLNIDDFVAVHLESAPIHHYIWQHRQLLRCDTSLRTHLDPAQVSRDFLDALVARLAKERHV